eukprot:gene9288-10268_t
MAKEFVKNAEKKFEDLLDSYNKMKTAFDLTTEFYSEKQITTEDFFGAFAVFLQHLENVKKDVMSEEERREHQAKKERELEEMKKKRSSSVSCSVSSGSTPSAGEEEIKKCFEGILRSRNSSQGSGDHSTKNDPSQQQSPAKRSEVEEQGVISPKTEDKVEAVVAELKATRSPSVKSERGLSVDKDGGALSKSDLTKEELNKDGREGKSVSTTELNSNGVEVARPSAKISPESIQVLPHDEPNAFTALLKRRVRIDDTDSERDRTDSSASDVSVFSTLPRARFKPPPPALPKKKRPAPPPLKPKPKQGSVNFKSMTLPRSMPKTTSSGEDKYDSESSKGSWSGSSSHSRNGYSGSATKGDVAIAAKAESEPVAVVSNSWKTSESAIVEEKVLKKQADLVESVKVAEETMSAGIPEERSEGVAKMEKGFKLKQSASTTGPGVISLAMSTYHVDVMFSESDAKAMKSKPTKPARNNMEQTKIIPFGPIQTVGQEEHAPEYNHDSDDYDNLPDAKTDAQMDLEEPDYALPTFAVDVRTVKPESLTSVCEAKQTEIDDQQQSAEVNTMPDLTKGSHYIELNLDNSTKTEQHRPVVIGNANSPKSSSNDDSDDSSPYGQRYTLEGKNSAFHRGNLLRNSSMSSSQSSDSDSPQTYRKFKQNRSASAKSKSSSTLQKLKDVIGGMRSRSSSDASTTSFDHPATTIDLNGTPIGTPKMSPRPILKKHTTIRNDSPDHGTMSRPHSPHTVKFQDPPPDNDDVMKLSTDEENLPELSIKIPPLPRAAPPPPPPSGSVPPPMPPPYHLRKQSITKHEAEDRGIDGKRVVSSLSIELTSPQSPVTVEIASPQPPAFKPPPPPHKPPLPLQTPNSPLSPTLPQFKPPPPPFHAKMKASVGTGKRTPPPPPPGPPPQGDDFTTSTPRDDVVDGKTLQKGKPTSFIKPPPPPPKRVDSIIKSATFEQPVVAPPVNKSSMSPPSSASLLRKTISAGKDFRANAEEKPRLPPKPRSQPPMAIEIDAEFDALDNNATADQSEVQSPPYVPSICLDKLPIVPPPPSTSPTKTQHFGDDVSSSGDQETTKASGKTDALPKSMFMVKVLPKTPPLLFREDEDTVNAAASEHSPRDTPERSSSLLSSSPQHSSSGEDVIVRSSRTDSMSSIGSMSFPPLPPSSLLETVEEDNNQYHTMFQF